MEYWQIVLGFALAFVLKILWTQLKWWCGYVPKAFDATQANIAAKECANKYKESVAQAMGAMMYEFGKAAILTYYYRLELPKFDMSPDPVGGKEWLDQEMIAHAEKIG